MSPTPEDLDYWMLDDLLQSALGGTFYFKGMWREAAHRAVAVSDGRSWHPRGNRYMAISRVVMAVPDEAT